MPILVCDPTLKCPFCGSEFLTLFRSGMHLAFDIVEADEPKEGTSVAAVLCGENHFFFIRSCDLRVRAASALTADKQSA
jgi:hypothetical protein